MEMQFMTNSNLGDLVFTAFPHTDLKKVSKRPAHDTNDNRIERLAALWTLILSNTRRLAW
jgi:hypothetical protein